MMCGEEVAVKEAEVQNVVQERVSVQPADWTKLAQARLRELIAEVKAVDVKRVEAELVWRALAAAEIADLPDLPWVASKPTKKVASSSAARGPYRRNCSRCGKALAAGESAREGGQPNGRIVCREGCPKAEAA